MARIKEWEELTICDNFLFQKVITGSVDKDIDSFLAYVDGKVAEGKFTQAIAAEVERVKQHNETRVEYMTLMMELKQQRREGFAEGEASGIAKGRDEGRIENILASVRALMGKKGWSLDEALDVLNVTPEDRAIVSSRL